MILAFLATALAQPLGLGEVLDAVDARVPQLLAAEARVEGAEAKVLGSRGAFDPTLYGKASAYGGKDPRTAVDVGLKTSTLWGPALAVGWARGVGEYPAYDENAETGPSGEAYARLELPLLDGFGYGDKRAKLESALVGEQAKVAARDDLVRKLRLEASKRYWTWVASEASLRVAEDQLALAERRQAALERQVKTGARAPLDLYDNERVLNERIAKRAEARRKLELAALGLSLLLRDAQGQPRVPTREQAPEAWPVPAAIPVQVELDDLAWRPDRQKIDAELMDAGIWQRRARNAVRPELTVSATGIQPLDADRKTEVIGGVMVGAPLAFREGIGSRRAADADVAAVTAERRALDDAIRAEIVGSLEARRLAEEQAVAARTSAERAGEVLRLERRRFELGGSDLFKLLQREDALAKARMTAVQAEYDLHVADALLRAALAL